jgi:hypothetical protein
MSNMLIASIAERPDWYRIEDDTVVTRDKAANAVSLFGDAAWDIQAYTIGPRTHIYFRATCLAAQVAPFQKRLRDSGSR